MDIEPSKDELKAARNGIYLQLKETTDIVEVYGSLANGISELNLYDFIDNQVQVIASSRAWAREADNRLRSSIHKTDDYNDIVMVINNDSFNKTD